MIEQYFNDGRHRESEALAFAAERAERAGDLARARLGYAEAARLEEENALGIPGEVPRIRSLLAVSAVALWLRAERWDDAARAGCAFLAHPAMLTPDGRRGIQVLIDRAWRTAEMEQALGPGMYAPVEATLSGGLVRHGLAPAVVVAERREVLGPLLLRVAEWRAQKRYRKAGPSALANRYEILEAPATAGSYTLRLCLAAGPQHVLEAVAAGPQAVVDSFLGVAEAASTGLPELQRLVGDEAYVKAFLRGFRDLAPDGRVVARVDLGAVVRGKLAQAATLTQETRDRLSTALRGQPEEKPVTVDGVLKSVNLRGEEPKVGLETDSGVRVFRIAKGEHDDTVGPKLNRRVRVLGMRRVSENGEVDEWADDVVLLDEGGTPEAPA